MSTKAIKLYLQRYLDAPLVALLEHAKDGNLSFHSCCCLVGALNADHALKPMGIWSDHYNQLGRSDELKLAAEIEFKDLGDSDAERRQCIIPLIHAEIERREGLLAADQELEMASC